MLSGLLTTIIAVVVVGGCDDAEAPIQPPIHDLAEPWQAAPFDVDPAVIAEAQRACLDPDGGGLPNGAMPIVLVDARGANHLYLLFAAGGNDAQCFVERQAGGAFFVDGGSSTLGGNARAVLPRNGIEFGGAGSQSGSAPGQPGDTKSFASGRVGDGIAVVEIVLGNNTSLRASLNRGWFAAWWPTGDSVNVVRGYDASGTLIGTTP
jgi:hypothetical protein